jgi:hypothetical protein
MIEDSKYFKTVDTAFPNLGKKIKLFWGNPEFVTLANDLQHDSSDRPRAGFPSDVLFALHELEADHNAFYPHLARTDSNFWTMSLR